MALFRNLQKLAHGLSLVALEIIKDYRILDAARPGGLGSLVSSSVKKTVLSATDLAGITKGRVCQFNDQRQGENAVRFYEAIEVSTPGFPRESISIVSQSFTSSRNGADEARSELNINDKVSANASQVGIDGGSKMAQHMSICVGSVSEKPTTSNIDPPVSTGQSKTRVESCPRNFDTNYYTLREGTTIESESSCQKNDVERHVIAASARRKPLERKVPSTPFTRALGFASLGVGLAWGTIQESAKRLIFGLPPADGKQPAVSSFLSEQNAERLALALCRMRGAALKMGQMLSIQDASLVPAPILIALEIVRQGADIMPRKQLDGVLAAELGISWPLKLISFNYEPIASASIGQVHRAVTKDGIIVAVKIQYPGVADSIESDIENVRRLLDYTNLIPEGLFLDNAMKVAKEELSRECDYLLEAENQKKFRTLVSSMEGFYVPAVFDDISSTRVLTMEWVSGISIDKVALLPQGTRNYVGQKLLELSLKELFDFRFMQTDPNWSNFLYDDYSRMINLVDFGAARGYAKSFVDDYLRMVIACANHDKQLVIEMSERLGFLTGMESKMMLEAHVEAAFLIGMPFSRSGAYDFRLSNMTASISTLGATMLKHRLTPPPDEVYSLHRKLSGTFLACIKLGAVVPCRNLLLQVYEQYKFNE